MTGTPLQPGTDEAAAVEAVASADSRAGGHDIPWANSTTGTAGVITSVRQTQQSGMVCRTYQTSRQSYDGIALYAGKACRDAGGIWESVYFRPKRASDGIDPALTASTSET